MTHNEMIEKLYNPQIERLSYKNEFLNAIWDDDLNGYIVTFNNGAIAQTQLGVELDALSANFGELFLERYTEFDDILTDEQESQIEDFVAMINSEI